MSCATKLLSRSGPAGRRPPSCETGAARVKRQEWRAEAIASAFMGRDYLSADTQCSPSQVLRLA